MKNKLNKITMALLCLIVTSTSCKKFLDINENPNTATNSTPELVLPQAIVTTASNLVNYNIYGGQIMGYFANAGGVSGWGAIITYDYTSADFKGLWSSTYDNLNDYQYVLNNTKGSTLYAYYNAAARIMKVFNFQMLVDTYGDIPYHDAFKGNAMLQPKYEKGEDIYKELAAELDSAINIIKTAQAQTDPSLKPKLLTNASDVLFAADVTKWKQLANTLKLKLILRASGKVTFANTAFDASGFLTTDAIVNPGYAKVSGKQNPFWDYFAYNSAGTVQTRGGQYIPTPWILSFYNDSKLLDVKRGTVVFKTWAGTNGSTTPTNQLGYVEADAKLGDKNANSWYKGTSSTVYTKEGIFKGFDAGQPLLLATESYFLQAEANVRGITGAPTDAKANFNKGIENSFRYLYKDNTNAVPAGKDPVVDAAAYITANTDRYLANFDLALTTDQKVEAIIDQKYIALNMIQGNESYNEFRRTGYPKVVPGSSNPVLSFASLTSSATTANKLPNRILYPDTEFKYNQNNVPKGISPFTSKIFWAL